MGKCREVYSSICERKIIQNLFFHNSPHQPSSIHCNNSYIKLVYRYEKYEIGKHSHNIDFSRTFALLRYIQNISL